MEKSGSTRGNGRFATIADKKSETEIIELKQKVVDFFRSREFNLIILPEIEMRLESLTKEIIDNIRMPMEISCSFKGEIRALRWILEMPERYK